MKSIDKLVRIYNAALSREEIPDDVMEMIEEVYAIIDEQKKRNWEMTHKNKGGGRRGVGRKKFNGYSMACRLTVARYMTRDIQNNEVNKYWDLMSIEDKRDMMTKHFAWQLKRVFDQYKRDKKLKKLAEEEKKDGV